MTSQPSGPISLAAVFQAASEPFASGFFECEDRSAFFRFARAQRRFWESMTLADYDGGSLYPCGNKINDRFAVVPNFSYTIAVDWPLLEEKTKQGCDSLRNCIDILPPISPPHNVGGSGYTHSIPHYERIIGEGLFNYEKRVLKLLEGDFRDGLLEVLAGIRAWHSRSLELLKISDAPARLIAALEQVPLQPARSLYEALVAWNFIYYIDGCDNPGRLDAGLIDYYRGENIEAELHEFFIHVDANDGWSSALGPDYNELTLQCLHAIRGLRRPSLELRVTDAMPQEIWDASVESLASGCGQPAFYCESAYQSALACRFPGIPKSDLLRFNGGGCTETMLAGVSNVGSLDAGINLAEIFSGWMREHLPLCTDFNAFYEGLLGEIRSATAAVLDEVNAFQQTRAAVRPQPVRTLLIDDCIEKGLDFNAGGARYYWSVINVAGLVNVIDSLLAIKALVYDKQAYSAAGFLAALDGQEAEFLNRLKSCPCFGTDDEAADSLASAFAESVFSAFGQRTPYLGGAFLPSSIQFATYADAGRAIPATPDGRAAGEPLADSIGAVHGKDTKGPTALLRSAAKLHQDIAVGTMVLNLRLQKQYVSAALRPLVLGYFAQGGMQVQVSCISRAEMVDAMSHPEKHENLIVRIGGYSEYFNRLPLDLKQTVLNRTEYSA